MSRPTSLRWVFPQGPSPSPPLRPRYLSVFNLDCVYSSISFLTSSGGLEAFWRNTVTEVVKLLKTNHGDKFRIWNLSEKETDEESVRALPFATFSLLINLDGSQSEVDTVC